MSTPEHKLPELSDKSKKYDRQIRYSFRIIFYILCSTYNIL